MDSFTKGCMLRRLIPLAKVVNAVAKGMLDRSADAGVESYK